MVMITVMMVVLMVIKLGKEVITAVAVVEVTAVMTVMATVELWSRC